VTDRPYAAQTAMQPIPTKAGIGLRAPHMAEVATRHPAVGWLEVHAENFMGFGPAFRALEHLRADYPVSLHGVGLSLGTAAGIDNGHLARLKRLADNLRTGTGRDIDPRGAVHILGRGAGAGMGRGLAVVQPRLGDAVALLGLEGGNSGRAGVGQHRHGDGGQHGRGGDD